MIRLPAIAPAVALAIASSTSTATELGGSLRGLGIDAFMVGAMARPGTANVSVVASYYAADRVLDGTGNPVPGIANYRLDASAVAVKFTYVWPDVEVWGANIESRIGIPYVNTDLNFDAGGRPVSGRARGVGDLLLVPLALGWHSPTYHQIASINLFLPSGNYGAGRSDNLGRGYFGWAPAYQFTWLPTEGLEVSGTLGYLFNSRNPETGYRSGNEFGAEYTVAYVGNGWRAGVNGYLYKQLTDDEDNGQAYNRGNRGRAVVFGPAIGVRPSPAFRMVFKWLYETSVENRTQGNRLVAQVTYDF
jgi:hypothetical protein